MHLLYSLYLFLFAFFALLHSCTIGTTHTTNNKWITSLPKVIWEEGRVAALLHTYAVKSPLVTIARQKFAPKSTPSRGPIPKPHYLPHPWTRLTYDAKRHLDPIRRFATTHWTDRRTHGPTHRPTDRRRESLTTIGRCATRATRPNKSVVRSQVSQPLSEEGLGGRATSRGLAVMLNSLLKASWMMLLMVFSIHCSAKLPNAGSLQITIVYIKCGPKR